MSCQAERTGGELLKTSVLGNGYKTHLLFGDGQQSCLDQEGEQDDGPAIAVGHMQLIQHALQQAENLVCNPVLRMLGPVSGVV